MNFSHMQVKNTPRIACLERIDDQQVCDNREKQAQGCIVVQPTLCNCRDVTQNQRVMKLRAMKTGSGFILKLR